jgi:hypothetical protein
MPDIVPFLTYIRSEYIFCKPDGYPYFSDATVFAISLVPNETLKFSILANDTTMFNNISINALSNNKEAPKLSEADCVFENCPDEYVSIIQYEHLSNIDTCGVWKKDKSFWQAGNYIFTIEWNKAKKSLQFIELNDGNYIVWANEFLTWSECIPGELPNYA